MNVGKFNATRLVRTEANYFHNSTTLQIYKDLGVEYYTYVVTLDKNTSEICREHHEHVYNISEAKIGETVPPLHPFCRSTIVPLDNLDNRAFVEVYNDKIYDTLPEFKRSKIIYPKYERGSVAPTITSPDGTVYRDGEDEAKQYAFSFSFEHKVL